MLGSIKLGVLLYALQLAANLISTLACLPLLPARRGASGRVACAETAEPAGFSPAVSSAVSSCLNVCGCVVFFRTLGAAAEPFLPHIPQVRPLLSALQEITAGCADFAALGGRAALYGCCLCLSVLGLSVWAQLALLLLQGAASLRLLALNRLLHLFLLQALTAGAVRLLPGVLPVYRSLPARVHPCAPARPRRRVGCFSLPLARHFTSSGKTSIIGKINSIFLCFGVRLCSKSSIMAARSRPPARIACTVCPPPTPKWFCAG